MNVDGLFLDLDRCFKMLVEVGPWNKLVLDMQHHGTGSRRSRPCSLSYFAEFVDPHNECFGSTHSFRSCL